MIGRQKKNIATREQHVPNSEQNYKSEGMDGREEKNTEDIQGE